MSTLDADPPKSIPRPSQRLISTLASDILHTIFILTTNPLSPHPPLLEEGSSQYSGWCTRDVWDLSHVCQYWRDVVFASPLLWTRVEILRPNMSFAPYLLRRQLEYATSSLHIRVVWCNQRRETMSLFEMLREHSHRWASVTITLDQTQLDELTARDYTLPKLERLNMRLLDGPSNMVYTQDQIPTLQSFGVQYDLRSQHRALLSLPWDRLRELSLPDLRSIQDRDVWVPLSRSLERLSLYMNADPLSTATLAHRSVPAAFPKLNYLLLDATSFLSEYNVRSSALLSEHLGDWFRSIFNGVALTPTLRRLHLSGIPSNLTDLAIQKLSESGAGETLTTLTYRFVKIADGSGPPQLVAIQRQGLAILHHLPNIRSLHLGFTTIRTSVGLTGLHDNQIFKKLEGCPFLELLVLENLQTTTQTLTQFCHRWLKPNGPLELLKLNNLSMLAYSFGQDAQSSLVQWKTKGQLVYNLRTDVIF